jgi:hypothetical protein
MAAPDGSYLCAATINSLMSFANDPELPWNKLPT